MSNIVFVSRKTVRWKTTLVDNRTTSEKHLMRNCGRVFFVTKVVGDFNGIGFSRSIANNVKYLIGVE